MSDDVYTFMETKRLGFILHHLLLAVWYLWPFNPIGGRQEKRSRKPSSSQSVVSPDLLRLSRQFAPYSIPTQLKQQQQQQQLGYFFGSWMGLLALGLSLLFVFAHINTQRSAAAICFTQKKERKSGDSGARQKSSAIIHSSSSSSSSRLLYLSWPLNPTRVPRRFCSCITISDIINHPRRRSSSFP